MKPEDKQKCQDALQKQFAALKKDHELTFDELKQQVEYALDAVKYPPLNTDTIKDQKAYDEAHGKKADAKPAAEHVKSESHAATAHKK